MAYTFLKAFYTREELGYDVSRYTYQDVTQEIIDIVENMGNEIIKTNRIVQFANLFKTIAEGLISKYDFISSLIIVIFNGDLKATLESILISEKNLIDERETIRKNVLAYNFMKQILNREKGNIKLAFNGF
ncbi:hypothetical protein [Campylobacter sputorum]|uniref:hypothetical protein n=1 Tax=Campylobacter sputorum TaxID=206 RepID=UPI000B7879CC|nr:hypothetical protein [Campylobacter sputorum]